MIRQPISRSGLPSGVLALFLAAVGLAALLVFIAETIQLQQERRWPDVDATVIRAEVTPPWTRDLWAGEFARTLIATVDFSVRGTPRREQLRSGASKSESHWEEMNAWRVTHPPGSLTRIRYNPDDPRQIAFAGDVVLPPRSHPQRWLALSIFMGSVFLLVLRLRARIARR